MTTHNPDPPSSVTGQLARLSAAYVFLHACMAGTRMAAPLLALREGHSEAAVGFLMALFALTQIFLALPAGRYADRRGVRDPMKWCVAAAVAGAAMAVAWPVFPVLCVSAMLTGGATGAGSIAVQRHVGRLAQDPGQLRNVFSWLAIGPAMANFLGPFMAGIMIDHAGFRAAFLLMALFPLVTLFGMRSVRELPPVEAVAKRKEEKAWGLWRDPQFRRLLMVNWLLSSCWDVHTFIVPVLGHERGIPASAIGSILGAFAIAAAVVRVLLPLFASKIPEWSLIAGAMLMTAALFAVYPFLPSALAMGACSILLGFALGSVQPMVMSLLHQITPERRHGEALAMRMMAINASSVLMPLLFGVAGAVVGVSAVFWIAGAGVAGGSRLAFLLKDAARGDRKT